jgi:hypothetical protein
MPASRKRSTDLTTPPPPTHVWAPTLTSLPAHLPCCAAVGSDGKITKFLPELCAATALDSEKIWHSERRD